MAFWFHASGSVGIIVLCSFLKRVAPFNPSPPACHTALNLLNCCQEKLGLGLWIFSRFSVTAWTRRPLGRRSGPDWIRRGVGFGFGHRGSGSPRGAGSRSWPAVTGTPGFWMHVQGFGKQVWEQTQVVACGTNYDPSLAVAQSQTWRSKQEKTPRITSLFHQSIHSRRPITNIRI